MRRLILAVTVVGVATCGIVTVTSVKKLENSKNNTEITTNKNINEEKDENTTESKGDISLENEHSESKPLGNSSNLDENSIEKPVEKPIKETTQKSQTEKQAKPKVEKPQIEKPVENPKNIVRASVKDAVAEKIAAFKKAISDGENLRVLYGSMGFVDSTYNSINDNFSSGKDPLNENESKYVIDKLEETWNEYREQNLD